MKVVYNPELDVLGIDKGLHYQVLQNGTIHFCPYVIDEGISMLILSKIEFQRDWVVIGEL